MTCTGDEPCAPGYACRPFPAPARCRLDNRILVQLGCTSHQLLLEDCFEEGCVAPRENVRRRVGDFVLTGMIFEDLGRRSGSYQAAADGKMDPSTAAYDPAVEE